MCNKRKSRVRARSRSLVRLSTRRNETILYKQSGKKTMKLKASKEEYEEAAVCRHRVCLSHALSVSENNVDSDDV